jgi:hypothetical protein
MRKKLVHLRHQVEYYQDMEYYQDTSQEVRFIRAELREIYIQFKSEREDFMTLISGYKE